MCCYKIEKKQGKNDVVGIIIKAAVTVAAVAGVVILIRALFKKFKNKTCLYCDENDCCDCDIDVDDENLNCMNEKECTSECDCSCKDDEPVDLDSATEIEINDGKDEE